MKPLLYRVLSLYRYLYVLAILGIEISQISHTSSIPLWTYRVGLHFLIASISRIDIYTSTLLLCSLMRYRSETSHPMWVRGLKHRFKNHIHVLRICVAPHVDAWIQTYVWWSPRQGVIEGPRRQKCEGVLLRHSHVSLSPRVHIFQPVTLQHSEDDICPRASLSVLWRQAPTIIYDQDKVLIHKENLGTLILTKDFTTFVAQEHFTPLFCRKFACYNRF